MRAENLASHFRAYLSRLDDGNILRVAFFGLLIGVAVTVALDYREMAQEHARLSTLPELADPVLPAVDIGETAEQGDQGRPKVTTSNDALRQAVRFTLDKGGVLRMRGMIEPGSAARFTAEIDRIGEYVKNIELDSPGGSVPDALEIAQIIRSKGYDTKVRGGNLCASSCPIVFSGGVTRIADEGAAIAVHQVFTPGPHDLGPDRAVASTQRITAKITRHFREMDVDPDLWLHALDTPPNRLYYFSRDELSYYRLVNG